MAARVFVALLITDSGRLTAAELAEVLRISPAAVSGAVRYLVQLGLVHKERVPGSRRDYYRMPGNMWDDMLRLRNQVMSRWTALVREGINLVGPDTPATRPAGRAGRLPRVRLQGAFRRPGPLGPVPGRPLRDNCSRWPMCGGWAGSGSVMPSSGSSAERRSAVGRPPGYSCLTFSATEMAISTCGRRLAA